MPVQAFLCKHKNKTVKVTVEFPEESDPEAEQEFISRFKGIYLEKVKNRFMQEKESALPCIPNNGKEEEGNG